MPQNLMEDNPLSEIASQIGTTQRLSKDTAEFGSVIKP